MKIVNKIITQELLKELLDYNQETGVFIWKKRERNHFATQRGFNTWNTRWSSKEAGSLRNEGYICISIFGKTYSAHRLAWLCIHGEWPTEIDHINHSKTDNSFFNIREASRTENNKNHPLRKDNKSGFNGVTWYKADSKWVVHVMAHGKDVFLGYFTSLKDAIAVRKAANIKYGFHKNHGVTA